MRVQTEQNLGRETDPEPWFGVGALFIVTKFIGVQKGGAKRATTLVLISHKKREDNDKLHLLHHTTSLTDLPC